MLPNVKKTGSVHKLRLSRHISVAEATGYKVIVASLQVKGYCRPGGRLLRLLAAGYEVMGCGRYAAVGVGGRHHPKLRSAYLGFSGVSPLSRLFAAYAAGQGS